jgi:hypothetical protein
VGQAFGADLDFVVVRGIAIAQPEPDLSRGKPRPVSGVNGDDVSGMRRGRTYRHR